MENKFYCSGALFLFNAHSYYYEVNVDFYVYL